MLFLKQLCVYIVFQFGKTSLRSLWLIKKSNSTIFCTIRCFTESYISLSVGDFSLDTYSSSLIVSQRSHTYRFIFKYRICFGCTRLFRTQSSFSKFLWTLIIAANQKIWFLELNSLLWRFFPACSAGQDLLYIWPFRVYLLKYVCCIGMDMYS